MAKKLSFSVESILSGQVSVATSLHKNDSSRASEHMSQERTHYCADDNGMENPIHSQRSSSIDFTGSQELSTPPTSPISPASVPSPMSDSLLGVYMCGYISMCRCILYMRCA